MPNRKNRNIRILVDDQFWSRIEEMTPLQRGSVLEEHIAHRDAEPVQPEEGDPYEEEG